ncbi:hypothetical protein ISCGN_002049 [Ixodes scapularis]
MLVVIPTILRFTFSPSAVDATSHPSRSSAGRNSRDLPVGRGDTGSSRSHDTPSTPHWLGWLLASAVLGRKVKRSIALVGENKFPGSTPCRPILGLRRPVPGAVRRIPTRDAGEKPTPANIGDSLSKLASTSRKVPDTGRHRFLAVVTGQSSHGVCGDWPISFSCCSDWPV